MKRDRSRREESSTIDTEELKAQAILDAQNKLSEFIMGMKSTAEFTYLAYTSYIEAGFDEERALLLAMNLEETMMTMGLQNSSSQ